MTEDQIYTLRAYFLNKLPIYFEKIILKIIGDKRSQRKFIEGLKKEYKGKIIKWSDRGFCRAISCLVSYCFTIYGFEKIEVRNIKLILGNKIAQEIFKNKGIEGLIDENEKGNSSFYTSGVGFINNPLIFHSIILINNNILLDMTASQMKRIGRGVIINNYWCTLDKLKQKYKCILVYEILPEKIFTSIVIQSYSNFFREITSEILKEIGERIGKPILKLPEIPEKDSNLFQHQN